MPTRRELMEEFIQHYRDEVEQYRGTIKMMTDGVLGFWEVIDGQKVDRTKETVARDQEVVRHLEDLIASSERRIASGELD
jgi:hypothetical protein